MLFNLSSVGLLALAVAAVSADAHHDTPAQMKRSQDLAVDKLARRSVNFGSAPKLKALRRRGGPSRLNAANGGGGQGGPPGQSGGGGWGNGGGSNGSGSTQISSPASEAEAAVSIGVSVSSATATSKAAASTASSSSSSSSSTVYTGKATYFYQEGGTGACGSVHLDSDKIVALQTAMYTSGSYCGKTVVITNTANSKSVTAVVADECPGCSTADSLDLSTGAFDAIGDEATGVLSISWYFSD